MCNRLYSKFPKWPLRHRRAERLRHRFHPDDLLEKRPTELIPLVTRRLQELWPGPTGIPLDLPSRSRLVDDIGLIAVTLIALTDALEARFKRLGRKRDE